MQIDEAQAGSGAGLGGYEAKYVADARAARTVRAWIDCHCQADSSYPVNRITSIYYDTPDWRCLGEKRNSDFRKTKIRLRWYAAVGADEPQEPARLECKQKRGPRRTKLRVPLPLAAARLSRLPLESPALLQLPDLLRQAGAELPACLLPALELVYRRRRWIDPFSRARVCLDDGIVVTRVNRRMLDREPLLALPQVVVEIKSPAPVLPEFARRLAELGCRRVSMSKYHDACEAGS